MDDYEIVLSEQELATMGPAVDEEWDMPFGFEDGPIPQASGDELPGLSPLAEWCPINSASYRAVTRSKIGLAVHHYAFRGDNLQNTFNLARVSTQYSIGYNGKRRQYVNDNHVSYATGTMLGNENFINFEISNSAGAPNYPVDKQLVIENAVELMAEVAGRRKLGPHLEAYVDIRGHRQFVATQCPGVIYPWISDIAYAVKQILVDGGSVIVQPETPVSPPGALSYPVVRRGSTGDYVRIVQKAVGAYADGIFGTVTEAKVKALQRQNKLNEDGICGPKTWTVILGSSNAQEPDKAIPTHKTLPVLRIGSRGDYVEIVQVKVGVTVDSIYGVLTNAAVKQWQKAHGLVVDGVTGEKTWKSMGY